MAVILSHTMYLLDGFRKSTPPQNRQLIVLISNRDRGHRGNDSCDLKKRVACPAGAGA